MPFAIIIVTIRDTGGRMMLAGNRNQSQGLVCLRQFRVLDTRFDLRRLCLSQDFSF